MQNMQCKMQEYGGRASWPRLIPTFAFCILCGCDSKPAPAPTAAPSPPTAVPAPAITRTTLLADAAHDVTAKKGTPSAYSIPPSSEIVLELQDPKFAAADAGPLAVHVAHGSTGYYRGTVSGKQVTLNAGSLDPMKGGAFPGFEAGESYVVAIGPEGTAADGALRFAPVWSATVKVTAH
jgi:hypothetical protein